MLCDRVLHCLSLFGSIVWKNWLADYTWLLDSYYLLLAWNAMRVSDVSYLDYSFFLVRWVLNARIWCCTLVEDMFYRWPKFEPAAYIHCYSLNGPNESNFYFYYYFYYYYYYYYYYRDLSLRIATFTRIAVTRVRFCIYVRILLGDLTLYVIESIY
jgi:hypothetical protein